MTKKRPRPAEGEAAAGRKGCDAKPALTAIERVFREQFATWEIELPPEALRDRLAGVIQKRGWLIQYRFDSDEKGEFLDVYSTHRMPGDDHERIRADGTTESLPAMLGLVVLKGDPDEDRRVKEANVRRNRKIARQLVAKGFDRFTLNMALIADLVEETLPLDEADETDETGEKE